MPEFLEHLRACVEPSGPIAHILERKHVIEACDLLADGRRLPPLTLSFLWTAVFTDRWYRTASPRRA